VVVVVVMQTTAAVVTKVVAVVVVVAAAAAAAVVKVAPDKSFFCLFIFETLNIKACSFSVFVPMRFEHCFGL
jgi:hypothetical protein